jgi:hypothetical protein
LARIARFNPAFCFTFRPGSWVVPLAEAVMFFVASLSSTTTAFLEHGTAAVWELKSARRARTFPVSDDRAALVRARLLDPLRRRDSRQRRRCSRSASLGVWKTRSKRSPSLVATATPRSTPTALFGPVFPNARQQDK